MLSRSFEGVGLTVRDVWWARQDSNLEPGGYEPPALTIELRARTALLHHAGGHHARAVRVLTGLAARVRGGGGLVATGTTLGACK